MGCEEGYGRSLEGAVGTFQDALATSVSSAVVPERELRVKRVSSAVTTYFRRTQSKTTFFLSIVCGLLVAAIGRCIRSLLRGLATIFCSWRLHPDTSLREYVCR